MPTLISLDIETTGLDPASDSILEIAAVRFNERRIEAEFETLVNPDRMIPREVIQLTGITNDMVRGAPKIQEVIDDFAAFIGDAPVIGHNVRFDLAFLRRHNILHYNEPIDTYELASVLLPTASRYNLEALAQLQGIFLRESHRALEDARTTQALFSQLYEKCMQMPYELIEELVHLSDSIQWDGAWAFHSILNQRSSEIFKTGQLDKAILGSIHVEEEIFHNPLTPNENPLPLDLDEISSSLEYGGPFSHYFAHYEHRPQQLEMLQVITRAISESQHLMVEAGTGIGKSFAYLIPAAYWALQNEHRVIISTNTINLQEQLIKKDIPDLCAALNLDLRAAVLKGRSNYLCPRRFEALRSRGPESGEELRIIGKVMVWLLEGGTGDKSEINLNGPIEREIWSRISAEDEACKSEVCVGRMGGTCPFYRAHQAAQTAHLIVVNHALLLSDIAAGNRILPEYNYLIVDEAHHIESATTGALSFRVTQPVVVRLMRELGSASSGIMGHLISVLRGFARPADFAAFDNMIKRITDLAFRFDHDFKGFFTTVEQFLAEAREYREINPYGQQARIIPATRKQHIWEQVEVAWGTAEETLSLLLNLLAQLYQSIGELGSLPEEVYDALDQVGNQYRRLTEVHTQLNSFVFEPDENAIYWAEISSNAANIALEAAPLHVGALMEKYLWHEKMSVILTSATLTTNNGFDYIRIRLNADEAEELALGSPFDYENSALLYLMNDIPEPSDRQRYQRAVENTIKNLARAAGGRMLVLFTAYTQLRKTSQNIASFLEENDIYLYEQGKGASPNVLLENFRTADKAVLLGTRAFWEGVDVPGDALSILLIVRLPFDVPSDPIVAARAELFDDPFNEFMIPEAVLRFRQGFGRLIRTQQDRGVVAILDKRILSKSYGKVFIESLPACSIKVDSMHNIVKATESWLNL